MNILLVEDNKLNQMLVQRLLVNNGLHVTIANHGREALELIQRYCFKLIIMDLQMPEMNGQEATSHIRAMHNPEIKNIPILAFSTSEEANTKEKAVKLGMNDFLSKPIILEELKKINHYIL